MSSRRFRSLLGGLLVAGVIVPAGAEEVDDPVVARVDGGEIHRSDLVAAIGQLPEEYREVPLEMLFEPLLNQLIDAKLLTRKGREQNLQDDAELKRQLAVIEDQLVQQFYVIREIDAAITEEALRARYDRYIAEYPAGEEVRARHILVATEAEAQAIVAALLAGADFSELAKQKSTDPSAATNGGDLGYFKREDMVPEFSAAAFALAVGETSQPVQTAFGWHVLRLEDRRTSPPPGFEEAAGDLRGTMAQEIVAALLERLRSEAKIERFNLDGTRRSEATVE